MDFDDFVEYDDYYDLDDFFNDDEYMHEKIVTINIPKIYREMQKIKPNKNVYWNTSIETFYQQALLMENYDDNVNLHEEEINKYYFFYDPKTTYESLSLSELRQYFTWRKNARNNNFDNYYSFEFIAIYINEIINNIGINDYIDGYKKLLTIRFFCKDKFLLIPLIEKTIRDYVIYYNIELTTDDKLLLFNDYPSYIVAKIKYSITENNFNNFAELLAECATYKLKESKFYQQYPNDYNQALKEVYLKLDNHYLKVKKISFFARLFGGQKTITWTPFKNNAFYRDNTIKDNEKRKFIINELEEYIYDEKNNTWIHHYYNDYDVNLINALLHLVEFHMREIYQFRSIKLRKNRILTTKEVKLAIEKYCNDNNKYGYEKRRKKIEKQAKQKQKEIEKYQEENAIYINSEIDISKLEQIRNTAKELQTKLIVEELIEEEIIKEESIEQEDINIVNNEIPTINEVSKMNNFITSLTDYEKKIILWLIDNKNDKIDKYIRENNLMKEVIIETINEKALNSIDDTIIENEIIIEDYLDELEEEIKNE